MVFLEDSHFYLTINFPKPIPILQEKGYVPLESAGNSKVSSGVRKYFEYFLPSKLKTTDLKHPPTELSALRTIGFPASTAMSL